VNLDIENKAAQVDPLDAFVQEAIDQDSVESTAESQATESAPVEDAPKPETTEAEKPTEDGFQKRINKVTADKYAEIKRAEAADKRANDLQAKLDAIEANKPTLEKPTLEQYDYDEDAFNKADVSYQVQEQVKVQIESQNIAQQQVNQQAETQKLTDSFNDQITALGKEDFDIKINAMPILPNGVANAIMQESNGAELAYHLASHLDVADKLAGMTPSNALMELGRISVKLTAKPEIKTSAAPDPIEPVTAGSALSSKMDDDMSINEWMRKYN
jgi:hypothetical protein